MVFKLYTVCIAITLLLYRYNISYVSTKLCRNTNFDAPAPTVEMDFGLFVFT